MPRTADEFAAGPSGSPASRPASRRVNGPLTHRLIATMVCLSVAPLALCAGVGYVNARAALRDHVLQHMQSVAEAKARGAALQLGERLSDARAIAECRDLRGRVSTILASPRTAEAERARQELRADLEATIAAYGHYGGASIVALETGAVLTATGGLRKTEMRRVAQEVRRPLSGLETGPRFSSVYAEPETGRPVLDTLAGIRPPGADSHQAPLAVLVLHAQLDHCLFPFLDDRTGLGETGEVQLVDRNGLVIKPLRHDPNALFAKTMAELPTFRAAGGGKGTVEAVDYRGVPVLAAYRHLDPPGWGLVVKMDRREAYAPLSRLLWKWLGLAALLGALTCGVACWLARRTAAPIAALAAVAHRLADGDMSARAEPQGNGEIAVLAQELNHMAERVAASQTRLEEAIVRRTAELRASQARLELALDAAGIGTWELSTRTGRMTLDDRIRVALGYDPGELSDELETIWALTHPEDLKGVHAAFWDYLEGRTRKLEHQWRMKHKSAGWRWVIARGEAVERDPAGLPLRIVGVQMDVTDRRRLEQQVERSARLESVGILAGGVAHDFNNILTGITGYAAMARETAAAGPLARDLDAVLDLARRAANLTRALLAFSGRQTLEPVPLNLNALVEDMTKMLRRIIGEDIDLRWFPAADLAEVCADVAQIEQVVMNLAVNARDAMPTGGRLTIETQNVELSEEYARTHGEVAAGPYVMLAVSDTGVGMSEETRARIFEPFFTTKEMGRGTGLGLAVVHGIVKQHNGHIFCYSEIGEGTTFKIYLPRADAAATIAAGETPAAAPETRGSETILLVEDEEHVRRVAQLALEAQGYTVLPCASLAEAQQVFGEHGEEAALLLTDVVMPGGSGKDLWLRLRERRPDLRVLYMSGYTSNSIVHHGVLDPDTAFLQKPFTPASLAERVRRVLDEPSSASPS